MCVIIELLAGQMIPKEKLRYACMNNPDGFGLIMKDSKQNNKMKVIRDLQVKKDAKKPENDYEYIYELLEENIDQYRILHLRHGTAGSLTEDNLHPFPVLLSKTQKIYLMHNGTLYDYKNSTGEGCDVSDTARFSETFVAPLLNKFIGDKGKGDISDPFLKTLLDKFVTTSNRVCLVSENHPTLFIGSWTDCVDKKTGENGSELEYRYRASNTDYFTSFKRGGSTGYGGFQGHSRGYGYGGYGASNYNEYGSAWDMEKAEQKGKEKAATRKENGQTGAKEKRTTVIEGGKDNSPVGRMTNNVVSMTKGTGNSQIAKDNTKSTKVVPLKDVVLSERKPYQDITFEQLSQYTDFADLYETKNGLAVLNNLGYPEIEQWMIASPEEATAIFMWVMNELQESLNDNESIQDSLDDTFGELGEAHEEIKKRDKIIADLSNKLELLKNTKIDEKKVG